VKRTTARPDELLNKFSRSRGSGAVTSLAFGKDCRARYPGNFFCHGCYLFEVTISNGNKLSTRNRRSTHVVLVVIKRIEIIKQRFFRTEDRIVHLEPTIGRMMLRMESL
jgi:hypothetical protein